MSGDNDIKILVVSGVSDQRSQMIELLRAEGYHTFEARDPKGAYEQIVGAYQQSGAPGCHLVIVDTQQPSADALVLLQELRAVGLRNLPLLVVSGEVSYEDVEMVAMQRPAGILLRPFQRELLLQKMGQLLGNAIGVS